MVQKTAYSRSKLLVIAAVILAVLMLAAALVFALQPGASARYRTPVSPKASLQDYSWEELSTISSELSECANEQEAFAHAASYGLCAQDGTLSGYSTKDVTLAGGEVTHVQLAGVFHDELTEGGTAGLTFTFAAAPTTYAMNHKTENTDGTDADSVGGWSASDMRAWLNEEFYYSLPADLRGVIASAEKQTANAAGTRAESVEVGTIEGSSTDWVNVTSDRLWLFSAAELCGSIPGNEDLDIDESIAQVYAAEGTQYRLFAEQQSSAFAPCAGLVRTMEGEPSAPCTWWLRSKTLEFGEGFWLVGTDGAVLNGIGEDASILSDDADVDLDELWGPDHARGVIAGFCL